MCTDEVVVFLRWFSCFVELQIKRFDENAKITSLIAPYIIRCGHTFELLVLIWGNVVCYMEN